MRIRFFSLDPDPAQLKKKYPAPDPIRNEKEIKNIIYIFGGHWQA